MAATPLGDAMRRLSFDIFSEVKSIQVLMRGLDPDMRTVELKNWIARSKRKLMQLYALMRWLSLPNASSLFRSVADFTLNLSTVDANMVRSLDELYFAHAVVFSMRSRPYELQRAKEVLCKSTYTALPSSLFEPGRPEVPLTLEGHTVLSDLDIFIRLKLALVDPLPTDMPLVASVDSGILCIEYTSYFVLSLSLSCMDEGAPWFVLKCEILSATASASASDTSHTHTSHTSHTAHTSHTQEALEAEEALLKHLRKDALPLQPLQPLQPLPLQPLQPLPQQPHTSHLRTMLESCLRASIDLGLKELHNQATRMNLLEPSRTFPEVYETAFVDTPREKYFRMRLWKSPFSG
jgi:hypothetical protein